MNKSQKRRAYRKLLREVEALRNTGTASPWLLQTALVNPVVMLHCFPELHALLEGYDPKLEDKLEKYREAVERVFVLNAELHNYLGNLKEKRG